MYEIFLSLSLRDKERKEKNQRIIHNGRTRFETFKCQFVGNLTPVCGRVGETGREGEEGKGRGLVAGIAAGLAATCKNNIEKYQIIPLVVACCLHFHFPRSQIYYTPSMLS